MNSHCTPCTVTRTEIARTEMASLVRCTHSPRRGERTVQGNRLYGMQVEREVKAEVTPYRAERGLA